MQPSLGMWFWSLDRNLLSMRRSNYDLATCHNSRHITTVHYLLRFTLMTRWAKSYLLTNQWASKNRRVEVFYSKYNLSSPSSILWWFISVGENRCDPILYTIFFHLPSAFKTWSSGLGTLQQRGDYSNHTIHKLDVRFSNPEVEVVHSM